MVPNKRLVKKIVVSKDAGARIEHVHKEQNKIVEKVRAHTHTHTYTRVSIIVIYNSSKTHCKNTHIRALLVCLSFFLPVRSRIPFSIGSIIGDALSLQLDAY